MWIQLFFNMNHINFFIDIQTSAKSFEWQEIMEYFGSEIKKR